MEIAAFLIKALELRRNQRRSRAELEALQTVKLRRLAAFAYRHSRYYRDLMRERAIDPTVPWFRNDAGVLDFVSPLVIVEIYVPGVRRFQMEVRGDRSFVFRYCIEQGLDAQARLAARRGLRTRLADILRTKRMSNVRFELVEVEDLPIDSRTGKFRLIQVPATHGTAGSR